jgi:hypothetical protein
MPWTVNEPMVKRLFDFVQERQEVRYRRNVLLRRPPWTRDPVLAGNHFTNIYREDDPGTVYVVENMLKADAPFSVCLWNVLWYRMFGREGTWDRYVAEHGGLPEPTPTSIARLENTMRAMKEEGGSPFTNAYMISNYGRDDDKISVMVDVMKGAGRIWHSDVMGAVAKAASRLEDGRQEAHRALEAVFGIGKFVAFQALVDISYPVFDAEYPRDRRAPFKNTGWATCGPGAERGLNHCLPGIKVSEWNGGLMALVRRSELALDMRGFWWRTDSRGERQPLDRANMANCLCEFDKYVRLSAGEGKGRRRTFKAVESYKADRDRRGHGYQLDIEQDALASG